MGTTTISAERFLVRIDNNRFLKSYDGRFVESVDTPSYGLLLSYQDASNWIVRLRQRGYPQCVITNSMGVVMTYENIKDEMQAISTEANGLPASWSDLDSMPSSELRARYKVDANFAAAVDAIYQTPRPKAKKDQ